jgi:hypothetical protein
MALIEDLTDSDPVAADDDHESAADLKRTLKALSIRLALPEELLPSFLEEDKRQCLTQALRHLS